MIRLSRPYAIIYIDNTGACLKDGIYDEQTMEKTTGIISDYYYNAGFLQWNFYLIIPEHLVAQGQKDVIQNDEIYMRKYVMDESSIDAFMKERFPVVNGATGKITLIKG